MKEKGNQGGAQGKPKEAPKGSSVGALLRKRLSGSVESFLETRGGVRKRIQTWGGKKRRRIEELTPLKDSPTMVDRRYRR